MKRILVVAIVLAALGTYGCGRNPANRNGAPDQTAPRTQSAGLNQASQSSTQDNYTAKDLKKLSSADLEAQADKVQNEIDQLLNDLDKDSDASNLAQEQ